MVKLMIFFSFYHTQPYFFSNVENTSINNYNSLREEMAINTWADQEAAHKFTFPESTQHSEIPCNCAIKNTGDRKSLIEWKLN